MTTPVRNHAAAKINLALHVTGQRDDGYHLIETIAVFADIGDWITAEPAAVDAFRITGPEAEALAGEDPSRNLVIRARDMLRALLTEVGLDAPPVALTLDKHLPAGAGIGGGSADAAATLRTLAALWECQHDLWQKAAERAATLGADVPMCLRSTPLVARGIGETITTLANMPAMHMVLVNPRLHVATPAVFAALGPKHNPELLLEKAPALRSAADWACWLDSATRNDLEAPSVSLTPEISACLAALREEAPLLVRMSGSGATCFGIYADADAAHDAATRLLRCHPDWWIKTCMTGPSAGDEA